MSSGSSGTDNDKDTLGILNGIGPTLIATWDYLVGMVQPDSPFFEQAYFLSTFWQIIQMQWVERLPKSSIG